MAFDIENLFKAVDILVERRLENVNFDRTIICTITDDSDKKNGCYIVSDGTIKFKAYANDTSYKTDDQVRVSVLNGDFSEKKFISGRYTGDEESTPITYKSPLESIIPITGNLVTHTKHSDSDGVNGLIANDSVTSLDIWSIDLTSNQSFRDLQSNGIYNTLTIKADFKTLLSHYDLVAGNFGLRLDLFIQPSLNSTQRIRKYITLDSSEMLGNPYSFSIYSTQAKKVDIVSTGIISEMVLWIYQGVNGDGGSGRFIDRDGKEIPVTAFKNILVKNIEIGFGSDIETTPDNTIELFTSSPPYYVYKDPTNETNRKELEVLWYNKTENNEYVGFRDGLYDPTYDEIEYLKKSNFNSRLMAQVGRTDVPSDEPGLKLSADLKDAKPIMIKARDALTNAAADVLYNLQRQVQSANSIYTKIDELVDTVNGGLVQQWKKANDNLELWNSAYSGALQYAYDKQNTVETPKAWDSAWETDYYTKFKSDIELGIKLVRDFFVWFDGQTQPTATQSGHRGNYDLYFYRIEIELEKIEDWLDELDALLNGNFAKLTAYKNNGYVFYEYKQTDFSAYDNKYCLYWYRYEPGYKLEYKKDANNDEFNYGKFMTDGWRRMTEISQNYGLPTESYVSELDGKTYYKAKPIGQKVIRDMVRELTEEKYAVILFYNHEKYQSNIITFTNSEPELIPAEELLDAKDTLKIEHDVSSLEHYQVYNEFNQLRSLDDGGRIRQLKCFYQGLYKQNEALIEAGLYWYIPNHNTMLTIDTDYLQEEGFSTDAGGRTEYSIDGYTYYYKKIKSAEITNDDGSKITTSDEADRIFYYKIKPMLEKDATNNTIKVRAYLKGMEKPVEGDITMTFSTFGSNGTKYTLSVVPSGSQVSVMENKPLQLKVGLRDYNNTPIKIVDVQKTDLSANNAYGFQVSNWDRSPNAFDISTIFDETNTYVEGLTVLLNRAGGAKNWDTTQPYFGVINAKVTYYIANTEESNEEEKVTNYDKSQTVTLNTLVPLTYASNNYYMSGATTIVYNNQGTVSYMSEDEYLLYQVNQKGQTPIENQVWSIRYYDKTGRYVAPGTDEYEMLKNYMPVLKQGENRLVPAPLYIENLDYIPVVICTVNGDFAWAQPIIITQNQYASSTLDSWNGSLTIDEKNGTILSTAVGAGKKEDNNSFSGVLMGDIGRGLSFDSDNMSGLGLYGFNRGAQSFCLSVDGTAFFGKAGRGRILINGDSGTIASASYETVRRNGGSPSGMMIDLDDGYIHILGVKKEGLDYFPDKDASAQAEILINATGVWNGNRDAYFKIRSKQQTNSNHYLMYIGDDIDNKGNLKSNYYLQTDDYVPTEYQASDTSGSIPAGQGFKLDLGTGRLDAYNFQLITKNVLIDSTDKAEAFFIIKDNYGINLLYAGHDGTSSRKEVFYLKSSDFSDETQAGTKINLTDGSITSYNFTLKAGNTSGNNPTIELVSGGIPYLRIRNDNDKVLLSIQKKTIDPSSGAIKTPEEFYLQSGNYVYGTSGTQIDLVNNIFNAYSGFTLKAYSGDNYILIDATAGTNAYPLRVGENFKVSWSGAISATGGTFTNINAVGGNFSGDITVTGTLDGGTIKGAAISGGSIDGATLNIANGILVANSSGVTIKGAAISGGGSSGSSYSLGAGGYMSAIQANMTDLTVTNTLTVTGEALFNLEGDANISGDLNMTGDIVASGNGNNYISFSSGTWVYGSTAALYSDKVWIGNPESSHTIVNGKLEVNAETDLDGDTTVNGKFTYMGEIWCGTQQGVNGTINYVPGIFGIGRKTAKFVNGILVEADDVDTGDTGDGGSYSLPSLTGSTDKFLQSTGTATQWTKLGKMAFVDDIKKKFKVTITGETGGEAETYYNIAGTYTGNYSSGSYTTRYFWYDVNENKYKSSTSAPSTASCYKGTWGSFGYYPRGTSRGTLYSVSSVEVGGSQSISLTASTEVTLAPNDGDVVEEITLSLTAE